MMNCAFLKFHRGSSLLATAGGSPLATAGVMNRAHRVPPLLLYCLLQEAISNHTFVVALTVSMLAC